MSDKSILLIDDEETIQEVVQIGIEIEVVQPKPNNQMQFSST